MERVLKCKLYWFTVYSHWARLSCVHLSKDANHKTAEFDINLLRENLKPTTSHLHNLDFSEHLVLHGVLARA